MKSDERDQKPHGQHEYPERPDACLFYNVPAGVDADRFAFVEVRVTMSRWNSSGSSAAFGAVNACQLNAANRTANGGKILRRNASNETVPRAGSIRMPKRMPLAPAVLHHAARTGYIRQHRKHRWKISEQLHPRVRIPFAAHRDGKVGADLEFRPKMLKKEAEILRKIWIYHIPVHFPKSYKRTASTRIAARSTRSSASK